MEFDLGATRWAEDPTMILDLVRSLVASPPRETVAARLERLGAERRAAVEAATRASSAWKRPLLRWLAHMVELYMPLREAPKHYGVVVFRRVRECAKEHGLPYIHSGTCVQAIVSHARAMRKLGRAEVVVG